ncbi:MULTISPECIES: hypothetical protein, partial [unclassified Variovorax]|uniref:hypothetical protein n=1 Tax=unclassified Variovorax TaxID=663243 RepID=UPI00197FC6D3
QRLSIEQQARIVSFKFGGILWLTPAARELLFARKPRGSTEGNTSHKKSPKSRAMLVGRRSPP